MRRADPLAVQAAEWMLAQILEHGRLAQESAVRLIPKRFGRGLVYVSDSGNTRLSEPVTRAFSRACKGLVTWHSATREWRILDPAASEREHEC